MIVKKLSRIIFSLFLFCLVLCCVYIIFKNAIGKGTLQEVLPRPEELKVKKCQKTCSSKECIKIASHVLKYMKSNVDPCEDFYSYACGNYIDTNHASYENIAISIFSESHDKLSRDIKNMLDKYDGYRENSLQKILYKIKKVFNHCMGRKPSDGKEKEGLLKIFKKIDLTGWPFLRQNQNLQNLKLDKFLARIRMMKGFSFVSLDFSPYEEKNNESSSNDLQNTILDSLCLQINCQNLILQEDKYFEDKDPKVLEEILQYRKMIENILRLFHVNKKDAERVIEEIWQFETGWANLPSEDKNNSKTIETPNEDVYGNCSEKSSKRKSTWCNFIQNYLDFYNFDISFIKLCSYDTARAESLRSYLDKTPIRIIANYIGLRFIMQHTPELNKVFFQFLADNSFYKKYLKLYNIPSERKRLVFCANWITERFQYPLATVYVKQILNETSYEVLKEVYSSVKNTSLHAIDDIPWLDEGYKNCTMTEISSTKLNSHIFSVVYNASNLNEIYTDLQFDADTFIENSVEYNIFAEGFNIRTLMKENFDRYFPYHRLFRNKIFITNFRYIFWNQAVEAYTGLLHFPIFVSQRPLYLNMGMIGAILAHELGHVFTYAIERCHIGSNESLELFLDIAKCLINDYSKFKTNFKNVFLKGNESFNEDFADNFGVYVTHKMLTEYVKEHEIQPLPGLQMHHKKLFLILYSQLFCEAAKKKYYDIPWEDHHSPLKHRMFVPFRHTQFFTNTFKCPLHTPMNPDTKCNFFA